MMATTDLVRDFCPRCMIKSKTTLYCTKCGNGDLIPEPEVKVSVNQENTFYIIEPETEQVSSQEPNISNVTQHESQKIAYVEDNLTYKTSPYHFLTGEGGTGKTFRIRQRSDADFRYIELCSTTGIAAVNLGGRTINSVLGYYDTKSLRRNWETGKLQKRLRKVRQNKNVLGIEECSMLAKEQLDLIIAGIDEINNDHSGKQLGLHLIGDFAQLPPVPDKGQKVEFCFQSEFWSRFTVEKLTKVWRQDNEDFVNAIRYARHGDGNSCVTALLDSGVQFNDQIDNWFNGTTLIPKNDEVDFYNTKRLNQINNPMIRSLRKYEGTPDKAWEKLIPIELRVKKDACVMILSNDCPDFNYVNGDIGWIRDYDEKRDQFLIELKRTGATVRIGRIKRFHYSEYAPSPDSEFFKNGFTPYVDQMTGDWVLGIVSYHPIKLAYASTIHKSQGLSLDLVQIDTNAWFFSHPGMAYVALSRCRTPEGLTIVGQPQDVAKKIKAASEVKQWI